MKYRILACLALAGLVYGGAASAMNNNAHSNDSSHSASQQMMSTNSSKPLSKVSELSNKNDEDMVYIQGFIIQNLGNDMYVFQDQSGTINVEIDDDLMQNAVTPNTMVWIAATVDKEGQVTSLEAEELQILPANENTATNTTN